VAEAAVERGRRKGVVRRERRERSGCREVKDGRRVRRRRRSKEEEEEVEEEEVEEEEEEEEEEEVVVVVVVVEEDQAKHLRGWPLELSEFGNY